MGDSMGNQPIRKTAPVSVGTQINLATREQATMQQVSICLQIVGMMITACNVKAQNMEYNESSVPASEKALPGEAVVAAENTFVAACERLDSILKDPARWGSDFQRQMEKDYAEAVQLNKESLAAQRDAALEVVSPHARLNPTLVKLKTGDWAAFKGDLNSPTCVLGIGRSPEECLKSFDESFRGNQTDYTAEWLEKYGHEQSSPQVDPAAGPIIDSTAQPESKRKANRRRPRRGGTAGDGSNQSPA